MVFGVFGVFNWAVYEICGELNFIYYENFVNFYLFLNCGCFWFIGLLLKIRGGIGLLVWAIVVFE